MSTPLLHRLRTHPGAFDFHQAVRLLRRQARVPAGPDGGAAPGDGAAAFAGAVRFRASADFAFPAADVVSVAAGKDGTPEMTVAFLSLAGAQGPLPPPLAERVADRTAEGDVATRDFLDLFHHRLVSLDYEIGRRTRPVLQEVAPHDTETAESLRALIGLGTPGLAGRLPGVDDRALLARAGLLARPVRSQAGLRGLLADHFRVPVSIQPLVGRWLPIPEDQRTRMGRTGASRALGSDAVLGARWHDPQAAVGIRPGPMGIGLDRSLLPSDLRRASRPTAGARRATRARALLRRRGDRLRAHAGPARGRGAAGAPLRRAAGRIATAGVGVVAAHGPRPTRIHDKQTPPARVRPRAMRRGVAPRPTGIAYDSVAVRARSRSSATSKSEMTG